MPCVKKGWVHCTQSAVGAGAPVQANSCMRGPLQSCVESLEHSPYT